MLSIQDEKTNRRNELRLLGKDEIEEIIKQINDGQENNILLQAMLLDLSKRLKNHKGKLVYGYLNKGDKYVVDRIIDQIEKIPAVKELYDLWYEKQEELQRIYSGSTPVRVPLSVNPEFKTIRNAVINAASKLNLINKTQVFPDDEDIYGINVPEEDNISSIPRTRKQTLEAEDLYPLPKTANRP